MGIIQAGLANLNYGWIFFLMLLESTVVPVPSEFVVTPAAYHAASGSLDVWLVILFATVGADIGASINYWVAYFIGRPLVYRFANSKIGKMCLLNQEKVEHAEQYFDKNGVISTLIGRLVPGIRHLISIPAGLAKMHYGKFLLYTTIGAAAWHAILAFLGWQLHKVVPEDQLNDKITEYADNIKFVIIGLVVLLIAFFVVRHYLKKRKNK